MILKGIITEDFVNYKKPSMTLMFPKCSFKCGYDLCQNRELRNEKNIEVTSGEIIQAYISNPITEAIVMQGLEPMDSFDEVTEFIETLRENYNCLDDVVIYSGYSETELKEQIDVLRNFKNIIIKFGRYKSNGVGYIDEILGVLLPSMNQYSKKIS